MANQAKDEGASSEPSPEPLKWAAIPETAPEVAMSPDVDEQTREPAFIAPLRLTAPGIYGDIAEHDYHDDPCPEPSLSRTVLPAASRQQRLFSECINSFGNPRAS